MVCIGVCVRRQAMIRRVPCQASPSIVIASSISRTRPRVRPVAFHSTFDAAAVQQQELPTSWETIVMSIWMTRACVVMNHECMLQCSPLATMIPWLAVSVDLAIQCHCRSSFQMRVANLAVFRFMRSWNGRFHRRLLLCRESHGGRPGYRR